MRNVAEILTDAATVNPTNDEALDVVAERILTELAEEERQMSELGAFIAGMGADLARVAANPNADLDARRERMTSGIDRDQT